MAEPTLLRFAPPRKVGNVVGRYYDPTTGQFLTVDPLVDETGQPYAYVAGNPVNANDPAGLSGQMPSNYVALECRDNPTLCQGGSGISLGSIAHDIARGAEVAWSGVKSAAIATYDFAKAHPELALGALTITVCAATGGAACGVIATIAFTANTALDVHELETRQITGTQFAAETAGSVVLFGGFRFLPQVLAESGLGVYAFSAQVGQEFSGSYRALVALGETTLNELVSLAATTCPTTHS